MSICQGQIHQILVELQNIFCLTGLDGEVQYSAWILLIRYRKFIICNMPHILKINVVSLSVVTSVFFEAIKVQVHVF
jgi:hypothetical protein